MPATSELLTFAAIGDLHVREDRTSLFRELFAEISTKAEVLVLCGDYESDGRHQDDPWQDGQGLSEGWSVICRRAGRQLARARVINVQ